LGFINVGAPDRDADTPVTAAEIIGMVDVSAGTGRTL
jgi:hypothetical protein